MIKNNLIILVAFFLIAAGSVTSFGQENYLPGKIVNSKNDTSQVYIDYKNWEKSPKKIRYKKNMEDSPIVAVPSEIKGFIVSDEVYVSAIVQKEISKFKLNDVQIQQLPDQKIKLVTDTVFLQTLIEGEKSLYHFKEIDDKDLFYIKQDGNYQLLVYRKYFRKDEKTGKRLAVENTKYKGQLALYLNNLTDVQVKLPNTDYRRKDLSKLFQAYYTVSHEEIEFQKKVQKVRVETGVIGGLSMTNLQFKSNSIDFLDRTDYPKSYDLSGGVFLDIRQARNNGKWSLLNELFFTKYNTSGVYTFNSYNITEDIIYTEFGFAYLKLNTMIRYRLLLKKLTLYVNAGMSNGYAVTQTNRLVDDYYVYGVLTSTSEEKALAAPRRYEQGIVAGLGATVRRFSLELRYEGGNGIDYGSFDSPTPLYESAAKRIYFLLGYRFGK